MADQLPAPNSGQHGTIPTDDGLEIRQRSDLLRCCGFQQSKVVDPDTGRPAWMWARVWRGLRDAVIANSDGALAYRVWNADFDPSTPFVIENDITLWRAVGSFLEVSGQLLTQAPPRAHSHFPGRHVRREAADQVSTVRDVAAEASGVGSLAPTGSD